jgi:homoserine dehydrogenase
MVKPLRMGLIGFGNIGSGVIQALRDNRDLLDARCPRPLELRRVADVDLERPRPIEVDRNLLTTDAKAIIGAPDIDVVIELIGGLEPARTLVESALRAGKHVVTANKAMLAHHGAELLALAAQKRVRLLFEAAVGGGMPVIRALTECLAANRITRIEGILNGTCNYILNQIGGGESFEEALSDAKKNGYAEPDPTADVESVDAANKIAILASLAFGLDIRYDDVYREGITKITPGDMVWAQEERFVIKQYALAEMDEEGRVAVIVRPALLSWPHHPLAGVGLVLNGVLISGFPVGRIQLAGPGAGPQPTASAVLGDLMWLSQFDNEQSPPPPFLTIPVGKRPKIKADYKSDGYWLRIQSRRQEERSAATVTQILARYGISIGKISEICWEDRRRGDKSGPIRVIQVHTDKSSEESVRRVVSEIEAAKITEMPDGVVCLPRFLW